jgi:hypothetical protein
LRLWQYLANSSLWIDEIAVARNVIDRSFGALLGPLDYAQTAPLGFLFATKAATVLFGTGELALRAVPLVCGLCSLVLFRAVARRLLSGWAVPYAVGLFALGIPFVYFSSQVKQYSSDVAAALLVLLATLEVRRRGVTTAGALWLGLIGAAVVWFSQPAVFVLAGIGAAQLLRVTVERDYPAAQRLSATWALWAASASAAVLYSLWNVPPLDREYLRWFWADGFMPVPPQNWREALWLPGKLVWFFGLSEQGLGRTNGGLNYRWSPVFSAVMLYGCWTLWRRQRDVALLLLLPVLILVSLSAAAIYPFSGRLTLFLLPSLLIVTAAGANHLLTNWPNRIHFLSPVALALLGGAPIYAAMTALPPSWLQHTRPVFEHVRQRWAPGDRLYVYYGAGPAFGYYARRVGMPLEGVIVGECDRAGLPKYLFELDRLRGERRVWVIASHAVRRGDELNQLIGYLDRIGRRLDVVHIPGLRDEPIEAAWGYLYDLSDPSRLATASADKPGFTPTAGTGSRWRCHGVLSAPSSDRPALASRLRSLN